MNNQFSALNRFNEIDAEAMHTTSGGLVILGVKITTGVIMKAAGAVGTGMTIGYTVGSLFNRP